MFFNKKNIASKFLPLVSVILAGVRIGYKATKNMGTNELTAFVLGAFVLNAYSPFSAIFTTLQVGSPTNMAAQASNEISHASAFGLFVGSCIRLLGRFCCQANKVRENNAPKPTNSYKH